MGKARKNSLRQEPESGASAHGWRIGGLWALTFLTYLNGFQGGFVFDNRSIILEDPRVHEASAANLGRILTGDYWPDREGSGLYRPLTTVSYLLNYSIFGNRDRPEGYHWVNFILHATNVSLVYGIGLAVFESPGLAFALAAIWGLHPLLTESVTNIVGRADLLAALGVLAALLCYLRGRREGSSTLLWVSGLAAGQAVGLLSKENAIVLIPLMLVCDFTRPLQSRLGKRLPFYAAAGVLCAAFLAARMQMHLRLEVSFIDNPLVRAGFWSARLTAVKVIGKSVLLFLWPAHLSADYSFRSIPVFSGNIIGWDGLKTLLAVLLCAGAIFATVRWRRSRWALSFFLAFFFVSLLPTSNLFILIGTIMAERFLYLPSIGLAGCLVYGLRAVSGYVARSPEGATRLMAGLVAAAILGFAARSYARNQDWQDDGALWTSAVAVNPESAKAHLNLGRVYLAIPGRVTDAIAEYKTALRIEPEYALAEYSLATALVQAGQTNDAIGHYRAALRIEPNYPQAHNNLGSALARTPEGLEGAIAEYRAAIRMDPKYAEAHMNLGNALASLPGQLPDAIDEYKTALRLTPESSATRYNLGNALLQAGRLEEAIAEYRQAIREQPNFAAAHVSLGAALAQLPGHLAEAMFEFQTAIQENPNAADTHADLGMALLQMPGRNAEAIQELEKAEQIQPDGNVERLIEQARGRHKN